MDAWHHLARDLTLLDDADVNRVNTLGGHVDAKGLKQMRQSSVFRIYHVGVEEMRHRLAMDRELGTRKALSGRSIQAIRASLDGIMVRETQKLNSLMVLLTIAISGGPFLGLLGTVVGVMITFASIAAAGDVNVNAIAPGIAAALVATVAGLFVAIPAMFGYNYLTSKIKEATTDMHVFVDEFITKVAEFYRE
jgi:biopolymer transport protein ExbB